MIKPRPNDPRLQSLLDWLQKDLNLTVLSINPASSDASFRRYFRIKIQTTHYIVMDAPPPQEDVRPFVKIAKLFAQTGIHVPEIHESDDKQGFLLLSDLGKHTYLQVLNDKNNTQLYDQALKTLLKLQKGIELNNAGLSAYNEALLHKELELFRKWFLQDRLAMQLNSDHHQILNDTWQLLIQSALEQPQVCVHRDYHSRNLMYTGSGNPGVLDFQDAVIGPISYDLVSLVRDCYISWPDQQVQVWIRGYQQWLEDNQLIVPIESAIFSRWVDWMGLQRHLKAIGIFSRLNIRDGKSSYLAAIPGTFIYIQRIARQYPELAPFLNFLDSEVTPLLQQHLKLLP